MIIKKYKKQYVTGTSYWHHINSSVEVNSTRRLIKRVLNRSLALLNLKLVGSKTDIRPEQSCFIKSNEIIILRDKKIADSLVEFFAKHKIKMNALDLIKSINLYDSFFKGSDISNLNGGMGYNNGLILFILCQYIQPRSIVESGVWRGYTTFLLDKASSSETKITSYDINLGLIEYKSEKAEYFEMDVSENIDHGHKDCDLAFFDDHVSHFDRLLFCVDNDIKFVILDDDVSIYQAHSDGWPPIPSAAMIFEYDEMPKSFEWVINNIEAEASIDSLDITSIITNYVRIPFPDLAQYTGYRDTSYTTLMMKI